MPHNRSLIDTKTALVVIDVQEAFRSVIPNLRRCVERSRRPSGFQILDVPVLVTEQYPKGLGPTAEEITFCTARWFETFEKTAFSSCGAAASCERLSKHSVQSRSLFAARNAHLCQPDGSRSARTRLSGACSDRLRLLAIRIQQGGRPREDAARAASSLRRVEMALFELMRDSRHRAVQGNTGTDQIELRGNCSSSSYKWIFSHH